MYYKNILQGTDKVERIVRQLAQANENLTGNVLKTILTANKVKEQKSVHKGHGRKDGYRIPDRRIPDRRITG